MVLHGLNKVMLIKKTQQFIHKERVKIYDSAYKQKFDAMYYSNDYNQYFF